VAVTAKSKKGPRGPAGPPGPQGSPGPQGVAGLSTGPAGGALTGSYPNPQIADEAVGPSQTGVVPAAKAFITTPTTVPTGQTDTSIPFDATMFDYADMHSNTINNQDLIAPIRGLYLVDAVAIWTANATGLRTIAVTNDGFGLPAVDARPALATPTVTHASGLMELAPGDAVHVVTNQTSGSNLTIQTAEFSIAWLGPVAPA
jgi:hypothetical protein